MPFSAFHDLPAVLAAVQAVAPARVLDVGVGYGRYGMLVREQLEMIVGRFERERWRTVIEGVEVFENYRTPIWGYAYDEVHIGDARDIVPRLGHYDLALLLDVIEHLPKNEGEKLLSVLLDHARYVLVSTPRVLISQGAVFGNDAERHVSFWSCKDLRRNRHAVVHRGIVSTIALLSSESRPPRFRVLASHLAWRVHYEFWRFTPRVAPRLPRWLKDLVKRLTGW